jgi:hypothetical protein
MAWGFGTTTLDGYTTKVFTVTVLDDDAAGDYVVALNGAAGHPNAFGNDGAGNQMTPRKFQLTRMDLGTGDKSEFSIHSVTHATCTIRKLSVGTQTETVTLQVTLSVPHSLVQ